MSSSKAIVLWGVAETGKTTTLNLLIKKLLPSSKVLLPGKVSAVLTENSWIVLKYRGKKIAIITAGDDSTSLDWYFKQIYIDCDIYICASRTKGSSVNYIKTRFLGSHIIWHAKWSVSEESAKTTIPDTLRDKCNDLQADILIQTIDMM